MKNERRHELQTNVLADWLGRHLEQVRPYTKTIAAVGITLLAVVGLWQYLATQNTSSLARGWREYFDYHNQALLNQDPELLLNKVATSQGASRAGLWAKKSAADMELSRGNRNWFRDREEAEESIEKARELYIEIAEEAKGTPMLLDRARLGAAQANESLCELDEALKYYELVAKTSAETALANLAKQRVEHLNSSEARRFYTWFDKQDPAQALREFMSSRPETTVPTDLGNVPDRPDLTFPNPAPTDSNPAPADTNPAPADTNPAPADANPAPADTNPAPADTNPAPTDTNPAPTDTNPAPTDTNPAPTDTNPAPTDAPATDAPSDPPAESSSGEGDTELDLQSPKSSPEPSGEPDSP